MHIKTLNTKETVVWAPSEKRSLKKVINKIKGKVQFLTTTHSWTAIDQSLIHSFPRVAKYEKGAFSPPKYIRQHFVFLDGKGGSSTDVNYVQVVTVGSQFANSETIFKCSFPKLSTPDELFWFFGEDMIWSNKVELKKKYKSKFG